MSSKIIDDLKDSLENTTAGNILTGDVGAVLEDVGGTIIGDDNYAAIADPITGAFQAGEDFVTDVKDWATSPLDPLIDPIQEKVEGSFLDIGNLDEIVKDPLGAASETFGLITGIDDSSDKTLDPFGLIETAQGTLEGITGIEDSSDKSIDPFGLIGGTKDTYEDVKEELSNIVPTGEDIETFSELATGTGTPLLTGDIGGATDEMMDVTGFNDISEAIGMVDETTTDEELDGIASRMGYDIDRLKALRSRMKGLTARQASLFFDEAETARGKTLLG